MKKIILGSCALALAFNLTADDFHTRAVPNQRAVVTAVDTETVRCGGTARAQVNGAYSNNALSEMGVAPISMRGPVLLNAELAGHSGFGDGRATATQTGIGTVISDAQGNITVTTEYFDTKTTIPCSNGE